ncbi:MAG TPA: hypothetical protein PKL03_05540, partial [Candidatus Omnitrophota bacterium]|nr:hypothetical protein [Candidatus Omnitrophota bacterium]
MKTAYVVSAFVVFTALCHTAGASGAGSQSRIELEQRHQAWTALLKEQKEKRNHLESEIARQRQSLKDAKRLYEQILAEECLRSREANRERLRRIAAEREEKQRAAFEQARKLEKE